MGKLETLKCDLKKLLTFQKMHDIINCNLYNTKSTTRKSEKVSFFILFDWQKYKSMI